MARPGPGSLALQEQRTAAHAKRSARGQRRYRWAESVSGGS
jgi:hypothetical protein